MRNFRHRFFFSFFFFCFRPAFLPLCSCAFPEEGRDEAPPSLNLAVADGDDNDGGAAVAGDAAVAAPARVASRCCSLAWSLALTELLEDVCELAGWAAACCIMLI